MQDTTFESKPSSKLVIQSGQLKRKNRDIETPQGHLRRNRYHLVKSLDHQDHKKMSITADDPAPETLAKKETQEKRDTPPRRGMVTRSGRVSVPPIKLDL